MAAYGLCVGFADWSGGMVGSDADKTMIQFVSHGFRVRRAGQMKWIA